ncbi:MAG: OmpA family protein [Bacteroidia bacterium]|nr:OmpA family protein [Bacteroidia bacterium]
MAFKKLLVFAIFMHFVLTSYCQNLINNGDFEVPGCDTVTCMTLINRAKWYNTSELHGALYFTTNNFNATLSAKKNVYGSQLPHKGNNYLGLYNNSHLYTSLIKSLKKDSLYCFTMYVSMAEKSASKGEFGVYFAKTIEKGTENEITPIAYCKPNFDVILQATDTSDWVRVCGTYKSKGGEKYLVIGNFKSIYKNNSKTFIFVDDISLEQVPKDNFICCLEELHIKTGDTITLKQLLFKSSSVVIENSSYLELNRLVEYLKKFQELKIQINGHTDNVGKTESNIELSKNRAKSVYEYLINKGIKAERMQYDGFGSSKPIVPNITEENKAKNRRVEIVFAK